MGVNTKLGDIGRWCIDTLDEDFRDQESVVDVRGWVSIDANLGQVIGPMIKDSTGSHCLRKVSRPDVISEYPDATVVAFDEVLDFAALARSGGKLEVQVGEDIHELPFPLGNDAQEKGSVFAHRKQRKLERLSPFLACPDCLSALEDSGGLHCSRCGYRATVVPQHFELLPSGEKVSEPQPPFSSHTYDLDLREMIASMSGGLILDDGSGLRYEYFDDVVNLEISNFPTVDVIGDSARLPFRDATFDGVISVAVLEHVSDPKRCVEEIARVVKPGGAAYVAVPFLQPYHGYPHHYFNMTRDGMRTLFGPYFEIDDITTPYSGQPIFAMSWFLEWYLAGLPDDVAKDLSKKTIGELASDPDHHATTDYVLQLSDEATVELACLNLLRGTRRRS